MYQTTNSLFSSTLSLPLSPLPSPSLSPPPSPSLSLSLSFPPSPSLSPIPPSTPPPPPPPPLLPSFPLSDGDYVPLVSLLVLLESGSDETCFTVTVNNDNLFEEDEETFTVALSTTDPVVTITNDTAAVTIIDTDSK